VTWVRCSGLGEVYGLVNSAKGKVPQPNIVLSGLLRRTDVSWQRIVALDDTHDWITKTLGAAFLIKTFDLGTGISLGTDYI
jgi:hypothetical protein